MDDRGGLTPAGGGTPGGGAPGGGAPGGDAPDGAPAADAVPAADSAGGVRVECRPFRAVPDLGALAGSTGADLVWLDSALPAGAPAAARPRARWSVLALTDGPFAARLRHEDRTAVLEVSVAARPWFGSSRTDRRPVFAALDDVLRATPCVDGPIDGCGFALGWVGFIGYEAGRESGGPGRTADGHADADLRFTDRAVVVDREGGAWALALVADAEPEASAANLAWLDEVTAPGTRADATEAEPRLPSDPRTRVDATEAGPRLPTDPVAATGRTTRAAHEAAVDVCRAEIRDGNAFQVCLTTTFAVPWAGADPAVQRPDAGREARLASAPDPHLAEYLRLRVADPVPFGAWLRLGPLRIASRSPERFLRIDADGTVTAEPIKGTRRRADDPEVDRAVRDGLVASEKDRAENVMIVDLLRNDLLRTAVPGSVHVDRLCDVETYASVHQLVSTISARLPVDTSRAAVVRAAFPPGSMTGAPKRSAMAIAARLEGAPRGVYSGVIGYFSASGAADLSVVIRTLVTVVDEDSGAVRSRTFGAGGAVTWSSVAADEADEVETKTRSVLAGVGAVARW